MISPMTAGKIMEIMKFHRGKDNAIKRHILLSELNAALLETGNMELEDVEMRAICSRTLPICSCGKGYFLPASRDEMLDFKAYLESRAFSLFERWARVAKAYPELMLGKDVLFKFDLHNKIYDEILDEIDDEERPSEEEVRGMIEKLKIKIKGGKENAKRT